MGAGGVQRVEDAGELQLQLVAPVLGGGLVEALHTGLARVVDEPVEAPEGVGGMPDEVPYGRRVPHVTDAGQEAVAAEARRRLREAVGVTAAGRDARALVQKGADRGQADARAAAGDQDGPVGEAQIHDSALLWVSSS